MIRTLLMLSVLCLALPAYSDTHRRVAGVSCPTDRAIRQAVDDNRLLLCMTPAEADAAQPYDADRLLVHSRLLPLGPSVVEWVYEADVEDWPTVVRFNANHVIGYTNAMPEYYREHWAELRDQD